MYARSTTFKDRPEAIDDAITLVRDEVMPAVQEMEGCVGLSMLVDRTSGSCIITTAWASLPDLESSAMQGRAAARPRPPAVRHPAGDRGLGDRRPAPGARRR